MPESTFGLPYKVLTYLGLWGIKSKNQTIKTIYMIYQSWAILYLLTFVNFLFWDLISVFKDVHKASTNLSVTVSTIMLVGKNSIALGHFRKISQLQQKLEKGLYSDQDEKDREILRKVDKEMKISCAGVYLLGMGTASGWIISGLALKPREAEENLPLPLWFPWEHHISPFYEFAVLYHAYGTYLVAFDLLSINLTVYGTVLQICAEYDILLKNTKKINKWFRALEERETDARALTKEENDEVGKMIVRNIKHHQKIVNCAEVAESSYVHIMLVQFGGSSLLITVVFFDLILVTRELNSRAFSLMIFLMLVTSDIFLFCHYGSRLINKSHEFLNSIYGIPWGAMNAKNRQMISIVILKAQRPPKLTVEKFVDINLYSLLKLTKIVYNVLYLLLHLARDK